LKELGRKHSPERIEANRLAQIGKVISEETRRKIGIASRGRKLTEEAKRKISKAQKKLWANPIFKAKTQKILWEALQTPKVKANKKAAEEKAERKRRKQQTLISQDHFALRELRINDMGKIGNTALLNDGSTAQKIICEHCKKPLWVGIRKGKPRTSVCKSCASKIMREKYASVFEEAKQKWMESMKKSLHVKPNQVEKRLLQILSNLYPNEWAFVGDWSLVIANKNPDFANINGKKLLIEMWGDYWHQNDNPKERVSLFSKYGYHTLIIWERELKDEALLTQRIMEFVG